MILELLILLSSLTNLVRSNNAIVTYSFSCMMNTNASVSYKNNVNILFSDFTNQASLTGYYNTSVGQSPNKVYGYYMCRGDTTPQTCHDCVVNTTRFAQEANCDHQDGISYSEMCIFRYTNHSMYGIWQEGLIVSVTPIGKEESKLQHYNKTLSKTIDTLIDEAAFGCDNKKSNGCVPGFATREVNVTGEEMIYSLGQCTPDIVGANCSECLRFAFVGLESYRRYQGAEIYQPNCFLIYDNTSFYDLKKLTPSEGDGSRSPPKYVDFYFAVFMLVSCIFLVFP